MLKELLNIPIPQSNQNYSKTKRNFNFILKVYKSHILKTYLKLTIREEEFIGIKRNMKNCMQSNTPNQCIIYFFASNECRTPIWKKDKICDCVYAFEHRFIWLSDFLICDTKKEFHLYQFLHRFLIFLKKISFTSCLTDCLI